MFYIWHLNKFIPLIIFVEILTCSLHVYVALRIIYGEMQGLASRGNGLILYT